MIVLDTHAWVWWGNDPQALSARARGAVDRAVTEKAVYVSSISAWEVAMLVSVGRLEITTAVDDWIAKFEALPFVRFIPVSNLIAVKSVQLPGPLHRDPADRIIIATALSLGVPVVTKDERIRRYRQVRTIW